MKNQRLGKSVLLLSAMLVSFNLWAGNGEGYAGPQFKSIQIPQVESMGTSAEGIEAAFSACIINDDPEVKGNHVVGRLIGEGSFLFPLLTQLLNDSDPLKWKLSAGLKEMVVNKGTFTVPYILIRKGTSRFMNLVYLPKRSLSNIDIKASDLVGDAVLLK